MFQFGTEPSRSFHDVEAFAIGLFQKISIGLSDGGCYPHKLVGIKENEDDIVEPNTMTTTSRAELRFIRGYAQNALGASVFGILHDYLSTVTLVTSEDYLMRIVLYKILCAVVALSGGPS
mmetsp:Transcript_13037/g.30737  ORF Transcript_13037/g.30737 Transcript_13037/m.30737 type:complete len:120 (+) Transcript_13037:4607-4966(+)